MPRKGESLLALADVMRRTSSKVMLRRSPKLLSASSSVTNSGVESVPTQSDAVALHPREVEVAPRQGTSQASLFQKGHSPVCLVESQRPTQTRVVDSTFCD